MISYSISVAKSIHSDTSGPHALVDSSLPLVDVARQVWEQLKSARNKDARFDILCRFEEEHREALRRSEQKSTEALVQSEQKSREALVQCEQKSREALVQCEQKSIDALRNSSSKLAYLKMQYSKTVQRLL